MNSFGSTCAMNMPAATAGSWFAGIFVRKLVTAVADALESIDTMVLRKIPL